MINGTREMKEEHQKMCAELDTKKIMRGTKTAK